MFAAYVMLLICLQKLDNQVVLIDFIILIPRSNFEL